MMTRKSELFSTQTGIRKFRDRGPTQVSLGGFNICGVPDGDPVGGAHIYEVRTSNKPPFIGLDRSPTRRFILKVKRGK